MARDYSNRGDNRGGNRSAGSRGKSQARPNSKSNNKRKAAPAKKRRSAPKKNTRKSNTGAPRWVWVGCVLFIAIAVGAVSWIATRPTGHPGRDFSKVEVPQPEKTADTEQQTTTELQQQPKQPNFAFYEMLPDYEVVIPGEMDKIRQRNSNDDDSATSTQQTSETASDTTGTAENYIIQVGAFTQNSDANQLKAKVTLLGLQANVVRSESDSGQVLYRVRSDIITSGNRLSEMLKRLHDHDIETLVLRRKD